MKNSFVLSLAAMFGVAVQAVAQESIETITSPISEVDSVAVENVAQADSILNIAPAPVAPIIPVDEGEGYVVTKPDPMELTPEEALWEPRETKVYAHIGLNFSNYSSDYKSTSVKPGIHIGVGFDFPVKHHYSFNPEMNYNMLGAKVEYGTKEVVKTDSKGKPKTDSNGNPKTEKKKISGKEKLSYLEIPLYSKWEFGRGKTKPFFAVAPTLGIGFSGNREYDDEVLYTAPHTLYREEKEDKEKNPLFAPNEDIQFEEAVYKKVDFSIKFKAGITNANGLMIYAGYQLGLTDLARSEYYNIYGEKLFGSNKTISVKNNNIFVSVGWCW